MAGIDAFYEGVKVHIPAHDFDGKGFGFSFESEMGPGMLNRVLHDEVVAIRGASKKAITTTTNNLKQRIRNYITAHFTGSEMLRGNQRRAAYAAAQSKFYDDIDNKGQYTGLVYSKFGAGIGKANFVDFLLLHVGGGTLKPKTGRWLRIPNGKIIPRGRGPGISWYQGGQVGRYSSKDVFFAKSSDGRKLYLLRRDRKASRSGDRKSELLATMVPSLAFPARLSGIQEILRDGGDVLSSNLQAELAKRGEWS